MTRSLHVAGQQSVHESPPTWHRRSDRDRRGINCVLHVTTGVCPGQLAMTGRPHAARTLACARAPQGPCGLGHLVQALCLKLGLSSTLSFGQPQDGQLGQPLAWFRGWWYCRRGYRTGVWGNMSTLL